MSYALVGRKGCRLCEEAEQMLGALRLRLELREVAQLRREYGSSTCPGSSSKGGQPVA